MTDLPAEIKFGKVVGRFLLAGSDSSDAGGEPDSVPATGTVKFVPQVPNQRGLSPEPATVSTLSVICTLDADGYLVDAQGAHGIWLTVGAYDVTFKIKGVRISPLTIGVSEEHTDAAPMDLAVAIPPVGQPINQGQYAELSARIEAIPAGGSGGGGTGGVTDHGALTGLADNDHPQYQLKNQRGVASGYASLGTDGKVPSTQLPTPATGGVTSHAALTGLSANDHPQYQLVSGKGVASGYAGLGTDGKVPAIQLPAAAASTGGSNLVPLIIFNGESNSGGYADNGTGVEGAGYPTAHELSARPGVQIWDNNLMASFQDLDIGTNNLAGHAGLDYGPWHGWELGLANQVEAGMWATDTVYLVKTGQGGSSIGSWQAQDDYYKNRFLPRVRGAVELLRSWGKTPLIYLWYSMGVNDSNAGTNEAQWLVSVKELHHRMRQDLGAYFPIFMTMFTNNGVPFNDSIQAYADEDNMVYAISGAGCSMKDPAHWDYGGNKLLAERFMVATQFFGQDADYLLSQAAALHGLHPVPPDAGLPIMMLSPTTLAFEEGVPGTFTVKMSQSMTADAVISVSITGGNAQVSPASLTFTTNNWDTPQTVTVTSPDDGVTSGDRTATVSLVSASTAAPASVPVTIVDADQPVSSLVAYDWTSLVNTGANAAHQLSVTSAAGGAKGTGGSATLPVDGANQFAVVTDWLSAADAELVITMLDDAPSDDYTWGGQMFVSGAYSLGGKLYVGESGYVAAVNTGFTATFPCKIRAMKSGNDVVYHSSTDGFAWTQRYVHAGVLAGKTALYPRVSFITPAVGQKVVVSYDAAMLPALPPSISAAPTISGSGAVGSTLTCSTGAWLGAPTSYAYQWKKNGTDISGATTKDYVIVAGDSGAVLVCTVTATNANGSASSSAAGVSVAVATTPIVWTQMVNSDSPSAGQLRCTTAAQGGGVSAASIDVSQPFELHIDLPSEAMVNGFVFCLDDANLNDFQWNASQVFVVGGFPYGTAFYTCTDGGSSVTVSGATLSYPCKMKMVKSGNDVLWYRAAVGAAYTTPFATSTGVLAGKTTAWVKALYAVPAVGQNLTIGKAV